MTHTEGEPNWLDPGSFDIDPEEEDPSDYSKLLARESNSEPTGEAPRRKELRRALSRLLPGRVG